MNTLDVQSEKVSLPVTAASKLFLLAAAVAVLQFPMYETQAETTFQPFHKQSHEISSPDALLDEGVALYQAGRHNDAIRAWQSALTIYKSAGNRQGIGKALGNLGVAYRALGQYSTAIDYYQQALIIQQTLNDSQSLSYVLGNLGNTYAIIGQYDQAIDYQHRSLLLARELQDRTRERISVSNLGATYADKGEYEQAIAHYQESLAIAESLGDPLAEARILMNLASAHNIWTQDHHLAIEYYQRCLVIVKAVNEQWLEAETLSGIGFSYEGLQEFETAIAHYDQGLALFQSINSYQSAAVTLNNRAHTLLAIWNKQQDATLLQSAEANLRQSIDLLNTFRDGLSEDSDRVSIFDTQVATYNLLQQILVAKGDFETALVASEEGRSRAFATLLAEENSPPAVNLAKLQQFARQQKATLVEYSLVPDDDFIHQGKARGKTAALYIWVVQPTGNVHFLSVNLKSLGVDLTNAVSRSLTAITGESRGSIVLDEDIPNDTEEQLKTLRRVLIEPIAELLPTNPDDAVIFIPQGELFGVPFAALQDESGDYLIQKHTILTAPSVQVLQLAQRTERPTTPLHTLVPEDFLVVGNPANMPDIWDIDSGGYKALAPLLGAEAEATAVANLFGGVALLNEQATEGQIRTRLSTAKVVHLATHGLLQYGRPESSGVSDVPGAIALTPDDNHDGFLTSAEIADMELMADLVVLSACDTGRGDITGDGVIGLSRSLIGAGASSVIVSLWSVPDTSTALLMTDFYQRLQQGDGKAQALRKAMISTMAQYPDPSAWAAFTYIGETK